MSRFVQHIRDELTDQCGAARSCVNLSVMPQPHDIISLPTSQFLESDRRLSLRTAATANAVDTRAAQLCVQRHTKWPPRLMQWILETRNCVCSATQSGRHKFIGLMFGLLVRSAFDMKTAVIWGPHGGHNESTVFSDVTPYSLVDGSDIV